MNLLHGIELSDMYSVAAVSLSKILVEITNEQNADTYHKSAVFFIILI